MSSSFSSSSTQLLSFPNELLLAVTDNLDNPGDVSSLILTCRRLQSLLTPTLHRHALSDKDTLPALHWACARGHAPLASLLLSEFGLDANGLDAGYQTPLLHGVKHGRAGAVRVLLSRSGGRGGADALREDPVAGGTPLHWAAARGDREVVAELLATPGVSVHCRASAGCMLPAAAIVRGSPTGQGEGEEENGEGGEGGGVGEEDVGRVLRQPAGGTPLHWAARWGNRDVVKFLVERGARITDVDGERGSVLHWAVIGGHARVVRLLVALGADLLACDARGETPGMLAERIAGWSEGYREVDVAMKKLKKGGFAMAVKSYFF